MPTQPAYDTKGYRSYHVKSRLVEDRSRDSLMGADPVLVQTYCTTGEALSRGYDAIVVAWDVRVGGSSVCTLPVLPVFDLLLVFRMWCGLFP